MERAGRYGEGWEPWGGLGGMGPWGGLEGMEWAGRYGEGWELGRARSFKYGRTGTARPGTRHLARHIKSP